VLLRLRLGGVRRLSPEHGDFGARFRVGAVHRRERQDRAFVRAVADKRRPPACGWCLFQRFFHAPGVHYCLGAQLARGLARAAVPAILDLPGIRPAAAPEFYGWQFRGPLSVPVTLTPATASRR